MTQEFASWLAQVAIVNQKPLSEIAAAWKKYCKDCSNFDQSPVKFEFLQWNKLEEPPEHCTGGPYCPYCGNATFDLAEHPGTFDIFDHVAACRKQARA